MHNLSFSLSCKYMACICHSKLCWQKLLKESSLFQLLSSHPASYYQFPSCTSWAIQRPPSFPFLSPQLPLSLSYTHLYFSHKSPDSERCLKIQLSLTLIDWWFGANTTHINTALYVSSEMTLQGQAVSLTTSCRYLEATFACLKWSLICLSVRVPDFKMDILVCYCKQVCGSPAFKRTNALHTI